MSTRFSHKILILFFQNAFGFTLPYFLATKFEAFFKRGKEDARTSKDFEDIVYLRKRTVNYILPRKNIRDNFAFQKISRLCLH